MKEKPQAQFEDGLSPAERFVWKETQRQIAYDGIRQPIGPVKLPKISSDEPLWRKVIFYPKVFS